MNWLLEWCGRKGKLAATIDLMVIGTFLYVAYRVSSDGGRVDGQSLFLGTLATLAVTIVTYHRGSSQGSKDKDPVPPTT